MSKFRKLCKGLGILIKHPSYINKIINDNDAWREVFLRRHHKLNKGLPVVDLSDVIETRKISINCYSYLNGGSLVTDLALLKGLAATIVDCRYFEIGTWRGESVVNVAENAKHCVTLNLSEGDMRKIHGNQRIIDQTGIFITSAGNVSRIEGNSSTYNFELLRQKFDLVFIDGDHSYDAVFNDTKKVIAHLSHSKTVVVWHDYAYSPDQLRYEVATAILDSVPDELKQHLYHVRNTNCCILYPLKELNSSPGVEFPDFPYYNFKVSIEIEPFNR